MSRVTRNIDYARRELRQAFKEFDTDKSGYIERH
jgi:Ca2+-binding EF-hand superfamily protein